MIPNLLKDLAFLQHAKAQKQGNTSKGSVWSCWVLAPSRSRRRQRRAQQLVWVEGNFVAVGGRAKEWMEGKELAARAIIRLNW